MDILLASFHWMRPHWLWLLLPVLAGAIYLLRRQTRHNDWEQAIDAELLSALIDNPANDSTRHSQRLPVWLATAGLVIGIIAGAGPSWEKLPEPPQQRSDTMVIIADLTLSMHATDIKPSRLVRARYKLLELLKQRAEGQTALLAYSGDAHVVTPLTDDTRNIAALLPALSPEIMPQIGSNAAAGFALAEQLLAGKANDQPTIVWVTDEVLDDDIDEVVASVTRLNAKLVILGVGSNAGSPIPLPSGKFLKDQYNDIITARLDRRPLQETARLAGGYYLDLQPDNSDINFINRLAESQGRAIDESGETLAGSQQFDHWLDRGPYLAMALLPFMLLAFRRGWLLAVVLILSIQPLPGNAQDEPEGFDPGNLWQSLWARPDQRAARLLEQQRYEEAASTFESDGWRGVSEYLAGDYEQAQKTFEQQLGNSNEPLDLADRHYNHGHALARSGQLDDAIAAYDQALAANPGHENAERARDIVRQLQEQQQQQQQSQSQDQAQAQGDPDNSENGDQSQASDMQENQQDSAGDQQQAGEQQGSSNQGQQGAEREQGEPEENAGAGEQQPQPGDEAINEPVQGASDEQEDPQASGDMQSAAANTTGELDDAEQARLQQWLKQIPDDPGGLLRRKFHYEREIRAQNNDVVERREDGQIW